MAIKHALSMIRYVPNWNIFCPRSLFIVSAWPAAYYVVTKDLGARKSPDIKSCLKKDCSTPAAGLGTTLNFAKLFYLLKEAEVENMITFLRNGERNELGYKGNEERYRKVQFEINLLMKMKTTPFKKYGRSTSTRSGIPDLEEAFKQQNLF